MLEEEGELSDSILCAAFERLGYVQHDVMCLLRDDAIIATTLNNLALNNTGKYISVLYMNRITALIGFCFNQFIPLTFKNLKRLCEENDEYYSNFRAQKLKGHHHPSMHANYRRERERHIKELSKGALKLLQVFGQAKVVSRHDEKIAGARKILEQEGYKIVKP